MERISNRLEPMLRNIERMQHPIDPMLRNIERMPHPMEPRARTNERMPNTMEPRPRTVNAMEMFETNGTTRFSVGVMAAITSVMAAGSIMIDEARRETRVPRAIHVRRDEERETYINSITRKSDIYCFRKSVLYQTIYIYSVLIVDREEKEGSHEKDVVLEDLSYVEDDGISSSS